MIKIIFTCDFCKAESEIASDQIEEKESAALCGACYNAFEAKRNKLERSIKRLHKVYGVYPYPVELWDEED